MRSGLSFVYRTERPIVADVERVGAWLAGKIGEVAPPSADSPGDSLRERLVEAVIGTGKDRHGKRPDAGQVRLIGDRIERFVGESRPIEARLVWVPKKRGVCGRNASVDLSEVFSLARLMALALRVSRLYPPGLHFNVFLIDFEGLFIEGDRPEIREAMDAYCRELRNMVDCLGWDAVTTLIRIGESGGEKEYALWTERLRENYEKLLAYWNESEKKDLVGCESYESYKELVKIGWTGALPREARDHFFARMDGLAGDKGPEEKVGFILRNFSASLLHHQFMILKTPGGAPLNISFTPPAPQIPDRLLKSRIDLRPYLPGLGSTSSPPWAAKTWIEWRNGSPAMEIRGWRESASLHGGMIPGYLTVTGFGQTARIRADFLPGRESVQGG